MEIVTTIILMGLSILVSQDSNVDEYEKWIYIEPTHLHNGYWKLTKHYEVSLTETVEISNSKFGAWLPQEFKKLELSWEEKIRQAIEWQKEQIAKSPKYSPDDDDKQPKQEQEPEKDYTPKTTIPKIKKDIGLGEWIFLYQIFI